MKSIITIDRFSSVDFPYIQIVNEFIKTLNHSHDFLTVKVILYEFYGLCIKEKKLIHKRDFSLIISKITIDQAIQYQRFIEKLMNLGYISISDAKYQLRILSLFCDFISQDHTAKIFYKPPNYLPVKKKLKKEVEPLIIDFTEFLTKKNYAAINNYIKNVKLFLDFTGYQYQVDYKSFFNRDHIAKYEEFLILRRVKEDLAPSTVYQYLRAVRLFTAFLKEIGAVDFKYIIPKHLIQQSKRNNEYVTAQDILSVIKIISQTSQNPLRDLSIFLLITETGCRPLEVVNIELNNLVLTERLITLRSKKSHQRTLKLSKELIDIIKAYLLIRQNSSPLENEQSLFLNFDGSKISTRTITGIFWRSNLKAFGELRFSPKSLRHTFITNALNNNNKLESVANVVGHKHLCSTLYYFYRNIISIKQEVLNKEFNIIAGE